MSKIAIIGAGLAGLSAAKQLQNRAQVTVFDKARGLGGRMSTRRCEPYFFDHGAQYFTARSEGFKAFLEPLIEAGVVARWCPRYVKFDGRKIIERRDWAEGEPRYVARGAMNGLAKTLAEGLDIRRQVQITELRHNGKWQLLDAEGRHYRDYDWVVCTAPAPQARALLPRQFKHHSALEQTPMAGCYALMLGFEQPLALDFEAAHIRNSALAWLAVNSHKPGRQGGFSLVLHSSAEYAEANLDTEREQVLQQLRDCGSELLGHPLDPADCQMLHLWRYANNQCRNPQPPLVDADMQLAATGDWICGGRVEGAFNGAEQMLAALEPLL